MDWETSPVEAKEAKLEFGIMFKTEKEEPVDNTECSPMKIKEETPDPESEDWHEFAE